MVTAEADKTLLIPSHRAGAGVSIFRIDIYPPLSAEGRVVTWLQKLIMTLTQAYLSFPEIQQFDKGQCRSGAGVEEVPGHGVRPSPWP